MLRRWSRVQAELGALQASAERAGAALASVHGASRAWWTARPAAGRAERAAALTCQLDAMRLLLVAVAITAIVALATVSL